MNDMIEKINTLNHIVMRKLHWDNMSKWSKKLADISFVELTIIRILFDESSVIMKDISERLEVPGSTLTGIVDRLEKKKIVKRMPSKNDRRAIELSLTSKGRDLHLEHERIDRLITKEMVKPLNRDEIETLVCLLEKISQE